MPGSRRSGSARSVRNADTHCALLPSSSGVTDLEGAHGAQRGLSLGGRRFDGWFAGLTPSWYTATTQVIDFEIDETANRVPRRPHTTGPEHAEVGAPEPMRAISEVSLNRQPTIKVQALMVGEWRPGWLVVSTRPTRSLGMEAA